MVRHPSTGEQIKKESDKVVKITVSKALKHAIDARDVQINA